MKIRKKYLIINADDFGVCRSINQASINAYKYGCVTSLSIMPCAPFYQDAVRLAKANGISRMGVHLTVTSEFSALKWRPVSAGKDVSSLVDRRGYFRKTISAFAKYARVDEVAKELENQIKKVTHSGITPTHLDCHMFALHSRVCLRNDLMPVIAYLCKKYNLPFRSPHREECAYLKKNNIKALKNSFKETYDINARDKNAAYNGLLGKIKPGVWELILHCGYYNAELRKITKKSLRRQADFEYAVSKQTKQLILKKGINLLSWEKYLTCAGYL